MMVLPLAGLLVVDFSQFLSGPSAALRLADLGARVVKVERPEVGDACRDLYITNLEFEGDSTLFHSINRNKESFTANLKNPEDLDHLRGLLRNADVVLHNFRPGVMDRLGLGYEAVRALNERVVYGSVSGYGTEGPWRDLPGQDLLAQSLSGVTWLSGDADQGPVPMGLAVADMLAGAHLAQGVLACLVRRGVTGEGGLVEVSLLESVLDFQFEVLTTHLNDGGKLPERSTVNNAHAYLAAPYGIYATEDGHLALAMGDLVRLGALLGLDLSDYADKRAWFEHRDAIKSLLRDHLATRPTAAWLTLLQAADYWCSEVLDWRALLAHEAFKALKMTQTITLDSGAQLQTLRCPIRIDGEILFADKGAPKLGADTARILAELEVQR